MSGVEDEGQVQGRRRRAREAEARRVEVKVRLSEAEREQLRERAVELGVSVPRLLVESALEGRGAPTERREEMANVRAAAAARDGREQRQPARPRGEHERPATRAPARLERTLGEVVEVIGELRALTGARR